MTVKNLKVLIRGGGELASAVACRMAESHFKVIMTEVPRPQAVRRNVSFCEAVYEGLKTVEGKTARLVASAGEARAAWKAGELAIIVDPDTTIRSELKPDVEIDAIIAKKNLGTRMSDAELVIGLGIGFKAGKDVHVVIETNRGHNLGRVMREGIAEADTGDPGNIGGYTTERVMRAPGDGVFKTVKKIGDMVKAGRHRGLRGGRAGEGRHTRHHTRAAARRHARDQGPQGGRRGPARQQGILLHHLGQGAHHFWRRARGHTGAFQRLTGDCYRYQGPDSRQRPVARGVSLPGVAGDSGVRAHLR